MNSPKLIVWGYGGNGIGAYYFTDAVCYGNPVSGPWVEVLSGGAVRRFEAGDPPVGGYSSVAYRIKFAPDEKSDYLERMIPNKIKEYSRIRIPA